MNGPAERSTEQNPIAKGIAWFIVLVLVAVFSGFFIRLLAWLVGQSWGWL